MMQRTQGFSLALSLLILAGATHGAAEQEQRLPLLNRTYEVFELTQEAPEHAFTFPVTGAKSLVIDAVTPDQIIGMQITAPGGVELDADIFDRFRIDLEHSVPLGAVLFEPGEHVQVEVDDPVPGTWTVRVQLPAGADHTTGTIGVLQGGGLLVGATTSRPHYSVDHTVVLATAVFEGDFPISGARVTANIYKDDFGSLLDSVKLADDGVSPDESAGDGLYTGQIEGLTPGHYLVESMVEAGAGQATAATDFLVFEAWGQITGNVEDQGVDTNDDSLFERIEVLVDLDIQTAGQYSVSVELALDNGNSLGAGSVIELEPGATTVAVPFTAGQIKDFLKEDGPYRIREVALFYRDPVGIARPRRLSDLITEVGFTRPYRLSDLQRPYTLLLEGLEEAVVDLDGNGLYDRLDLTFQVDTLKAGFYNWSALLKALDEVVIASAADSGFLEAGVSEVSLSFDGTRIGRSGISGPYQLADAGIYGPPDAADLLGFVGLTSALTASKFEGGEVSFEGLIAQVQELVIAGRPNQADGIRTSLLRKLENARDRVEDDKPTPAQNLLAAFISELNAQTGKHVASADAERLSGLARQLIEML